MAKITSFNAYEYGGPVRPGEMANIAIVATYAGGPVDALVRISGFGRSVTYGPVRDFTNPLILDLPFQIPGGAVVPGVTITGYKITPNHTVYGKPFVRVELYTLENGQWRLAAVKDVPVSLIGLKPPQASNKITSNNSPDEPTKKGSSIWPLLILGATLLG